jgi:hypothetical protein
LIFVASLKKNPFAIHKNVSVLPMEALAERRRQRKLTTFYKMHNKSCPQYLSECLPPVASDVSGYNLRNNENYVLPDVDYE